MSSPYGVKTLINKTFSGRFFMARLTRFGPLGRVVEDMLFKDDEIIYLPQDEVIPVNQSVAEPESLAVPSRVVEHFIRRAACHWVMDFCICRDSARCEDFPVEYGCLFLGAAAGPTGAINLVIDDETFINQAIARISSLVDLS